MTTLAKASHDGERYELFSPTRMPQAAGFLWNQRMMIQITCGGYAVSQFMQPEPAKYSHPPTLAATTFMQPEHPYFAHHPGRFFYVKDEETGQVFSAPHEPVRRQPDSFVFSVGKSNIEWRVECDGIVVELKLTIPVSDVVELWSVTVKNASGRRRRISLYPYFSVGYSSWMNQSGEYRPDVQGIICSSVTPYQKVADYFKNKNFKDKTYLVSDTAPASWEVNQAAFEGEGTLAAPGALARPELARGDVRFEIPACVLQYRMELELAGAKTVRLLFGPAFDDAEVKQVRDRYFGHSEFDGAAKDYAAYVRSGEGCLHIETPDAALDNFVNHWLPRQVFYHGDVNRLTTDPQTRNYLQDAMGMCYVNPRATRHAFLVALAQQKASGEMPDGILLVEGAVLKYINTVPHTDHCVWLPVCLRAYLDETNDYALLDEQVVFADSPEQATVFEHISRAMGWLLGARDHRGLNYIAQGDWCDPMNMVGYKGKGVSGWLSLATAYALNLWADVCSERRQDALTDKFRHSAREMNDAVNKHLWDGAWYARGITDDGVVFGVKSDTEGKIFLNPQSWAILSGAADLERRRSLIAAVEERLETPYGVEKIGPPFTKMRDDVGRVTQKHPGSGENGSVYNHASAFYFYSLYQAGEADRAFRALRAMVPGPGESDLIQRGQLPVFVPNYYRGAYRQFPRTAGRSSQLFNTGTAGWFYRSVVDGLFGLRGSPRGLRIEPQLPSGWPGAKVRRRFRGADFAIEMRRELGGKQIQVRVDGQAITQPLIENVIPGRQYRVDVLLPR